MKKDIEIFKGKWRLKRGLAAICLIVFLLIAPFFLRIDVSNQKFYFFGLSIFFNELILVVPVFIGTLFLILAVTSKWGRVWCGWACPHSVFLEFVYRPYEKWVKSPVLKWFGFIVFSVIVGNIFIGFVAGPERVFQMMTQNPIDHSGYFTAMLIISGGFLFNFGFFRERTCTFTCPYGRLQSVLLDGNSLVVQYDSKRGEPRGKKGTVSGDCVDCKRCIAVCPTRIDIRNGVQLECIHCTACMDVCDEVMTRVGRDTGLIRYSTENKLRGVFSKSRMRQVLYIAAASILFAFAVFMLSRRELVDVVVFRSAIADTVVQETGYLTRHVRLSVRNKQDLDLPIKFTVNSSDPITIHAPQNGTILKSGEKRIVELFLKIPESHIHFGVATETITVSVGDLKRQIAIQMVGRL